MNTTLENTAAAITPLQLAQLAANPHAAAVIVQDAVGDVHVLDHLSRFQLEDPDVVVLCTRTRALSILEEQAAALTALLRDAGDLL